MRCMACGDEMVLAEVAPAAAMGVQGFEHHTFQCPGCDDTECRLVFTDRPTVFVRRASETVVTAFEPSEIEQAVEAPPISNAPNHEGVSNAASVEICAADTEKPASGGDWLTKFAGEGADAPDTPLPEEDARESANSNISVPAWVRAVNKLRTYQADLDQRVGQTKKTNSNIEFDKVWDSLVVPPRNQLSCTAQSRDLARASGQRLSPAASTTACTCSSQSPEPSQEAGLEAA